MTTSKYDLAYGRQGGRIVPWTPLSVPFHVGDVVRFRPDHPLQPNAAGSTVTVVAIETGSRARVVWGSDGAELVVSFDAIEHISGVARSGDGVTSHAAADAQTLPKLRRSHQQVLDAIVNAGDRGLTDFELADRTGRKQTSFGKRRGELVRAGLVVWSGQTRPSDTGTQAKVWIATARGLDLWRAQLGAAS